MKTAFAMILLIASFIIPLDLYGNYYSYSSSETITYSEAYIIALILVPERQSRVYRSSVGWGSNITQILKWNQTRVIIRRHLKRMDDAFYNLHRSKQDALNKKKSNCLINIYDKTIKDAYDVLITAKFEPKVIRLIEKAGIEGKLINEYRSIMRNRLVEQLIKEQKRTAYKLWVDRQIEDLDRARKRVKARWKSIDERNSIYGKNSEESQRKKSLDRIDSNKISPPLRSIEIEIELEIKNLSSKPNTFDSKIKSPLRSKNR